MRYQDDYNRKKNNNHKNFKNRGGNNKMKEDNYGLEGYSLEKDYDATVGGENAKSEYISSVNQAATSADSSVNNYNPRKRAFDLAGYIVDPRELSKEVTNMLAGVGVSHKAVHSVKIFKNNKNIEITATVEEWALKDKGGNKRPNSLIGIGDRDSRKFRIRSEVFNGLRNKAFVGELHYQKEKIKGDNYIVLNFDADVLLCFIYDIPYDNEFLKISSIPVEIGRKAVKKLGYVPCSAIIQWKVPTEGESTKFSVQQVIEYSKE